MTEPEIMELIIDGVDGGGRDDDGDIYLELIDGSTVWFLVDDEGIQMMIGKSLDS